MKEKMKRAAAFAAAALMVFSLSVNVFAEPTSRPRPGSDTSVSDTVDNTDNENSADEESSTAKETVKETKAPAQQQSEVAGKSYTTKGGAFLWFLLSVIVNTAISLAIANRFYKLTRRQNHVQSELRALRRDIEEKFIDNVGGFAEPNVDITNTNDDYSMDADGIKMTPSSTVSVDEGEGDVYKQWEEQFGARYAAMKEDEEKSTRTYQPTRESAQTSSVRERILARRAEREKGNQEAEELEVEYIEDEENGIAKKLGNVGNKAKQLLGGIFPFDEEDDE